MARGSSSHRGSIKMGWVLLILLVTVGLFFNGLERRYRDKHKR